MADGNLVPRLCHVRKWPDFSGYGFNLHAEKGRAGQFIGKVDVDSPAEVAGLREGDRIVEVNGTNIANENHAQVVQRIKAVPNETKMLVVDQETDTKYRDDKVIVRGDLPEVHSGDSGSYPGDDSVKAAEAREEAVEAVGVTETAAPPPAAAADSDLENGNDLEPEVVAAVNQVDEITDHPYKARLCHLKIWPTFQGYGFNLHAEKNKPGQYIGKVDEGSPSEAAGLREGDKIIEVNGDNISTANHQGVVSKIKMNAKEAKLLVMDAEALAYFEREGVTVASSSACVETIICPDEQMQNEAPKVVVVNSEPEPEPEPERAVVVDHPYKPRLCRIRVWPDWQGFGFNMHTEKGKSGQYIGTVDSGSPADLAGLKEGDKIVEVNQDNVIGCDHSTTVGKIKSNPNETTLLLMDKETESYFDDKGINVNSSMDFVVHLESPASRPIANGTTVTQVEVTEVEETQQVNGEPEPEDSASAKKEEEPEPVVVATTSEPPVSEAPQMNEAEEAANAIAAAVEEGERQLMQEDCEEEPDYEQVVEVVPVPIVQEREEEVEEEEGPPEYTVAVDDNENVQDKVVDTVNEDELEMVVENHTAEPEPEPEHEPEPAYEPQPSPEPSPELQKAPVPVTPEPASPTPKSPVVIDGIEFAGSAKEARNRMSRKKNVKDTTVSMKDKFDMFQRL